MSLPCSRCHENPSLQRENGCVEDSPIPDRWQVGEYKFQRCPGAIVTKDSMYCIRIYNWMMRNQLPGNLPWDEQSIKFAEAMDLIAAEIGKMEEAAAERLRKKY